MLGALDSLRGAQPYGWNTHESAVELCAAPAAIRSSTNPGNSSFAIMRPRASRPWKCTPCGAPLRGAGVSGRSSLSRTITCSK